MAVWLIKTDPETYSWDDLNRDKFTVWDGIRNYQARNYLKEMKIGDTILFYHSQVAKSIVGIAEVIKECFNDITADDGQWLAIEIAPVKTMKKYVSLEQLKNHPDLQTLPLLKQQRLSVMPVSEVQFQIIMALSK